MSRHLPIRTLATPAAELVVICGKCSRKLEGGFGDDGTTSLAKALRRALHAGKGKRAVVRIVETKCLDICPRHAVVVTRGHAPSELLIVQRETDVALVVESLGLTSQVQPPGHQDVSSIS
jgi:predicted metal-binding protein